MMLTNRERVDIEMLLSQVQNDIDYMRQWVGDPNAHFTRGHCDRYQRMSIYLSHLLKVNALAIGDATEDAKMPARPHVTEREQEVLREAAAISVSYGLSARSPEIREQMNETRSPADLELMERGASSVFHAIQEVIEPGYWARLKRELDADDAERSSAVNAQIAPEEPK